MNEFVKEIFKIVGVLVLSLLLFDVIFGNAGANVMYQAVSREYKSIWVDATADSGNIKKDTYDRTFDSAVSIEE